MKNIFINTKCMLLFLGAIAHFLGEGQAQSVTEQQCSSSNNCFDCVSAACSWTVGGCFDDCMQVADAACYSSNYFEGKTAGEICKVEEDSIKDSDTCGALSSCNDCLETSLPSDGSKRCMWFETGFCMSGCGMDGCGVSECSAETEEGESSGSIKLADDKDLSSLGGSSGSIKLADDNDLSSLGGEKPTSEACAICVRQSAMLRMISIGALYFFFQRS
eukprot:CAMPEP_0201954376 /NCGR_PEP_ID=MMETSP0904-20121228/2387_1 /ASSEMBLY_ACC=CAM_ASM_000553 /TAXON_ID=420261 /ORGANISM="Thalassiosira antarctica, Strain CCMP982" /LENGTH=217 /DNA_ID=CAMNT_0048498393 /DNA_START=13 /DNA_END=666 /DNA_ORIENTATION=+